MPGKIFINYRRKDARDMAARIQDRLTSTFGTDGIFMDVDKLKPGQRFDHELSKALAATDVFLPVIGPKWMELFTERLASGKRDFVREEIAEALKRGVTVIPVLVEQTPLPDGDALPPDIREFVLHQKLAVTHEQFGRDVAGLVDAVQFARTKPEEQPKVQARSLRLPAIIGLGVVLAILGVGLGIKYVQTPHLSMGSPPSTMPLGDCKKDSDANKAIAACTDVLSRFANSIEAYLVRGEANRRLNRYGDAIADYTKVINMQGASTNALLEALGGRADAYQLNGATSEAAADNKRLFQLLPSKPNR